MPEPAHRDRRRADLLRSATWRSWFSTPVATGLWVTALVFGLAVFIGTCLGVGSPIGLPTEPDERDGDEILVAGVHYDIGTPVVLWNDPHGYDAYEELPRFEDPPRDADGNPVRERRYGARENLPAELAAEVARDGWSPATLRRACRQFVLHYDVAGISKQCFRILQDRRKLSVHFLLDVDGTIYQTLDLQERAWHGGVANSRSVGIEIANLGAYPSPGHPSLQNWYAKDDQGRWYVDYPNWLRDRGLGIRTPDFVARPARQEIVSGAIHGQLVHQFDYTPEQHAALAHLTAALHRILDIPLDAPRGPDGEVLQRDLSAAELASFEGVLGHFHVTDNKTDPGPALDFDALLQRARRLLEP